MTTQAILKEPGEIAQAAARAEMGIGQCIGFLVAAQMFTRWDAPKCGMYRVAKQMAPRNKWIDEQQLKISEKEKI